MPALALSEQAALDVQRIDRDRGVIRDVKVLGRTSKNSKTYSDRALDDVCRLAEGATVLLDCPVQRPAVCDPDAD